LGADDFEAIVVKFPYRVLARKENFMTKRAMLLASFLLAIAGLANAAIHEVFNQTYSQTTAVSTLDLVAPSTLDKSYLITIYEDIIGIASSGNSDLVTPYISWTDDVGAEQLGNHLCPVSCAAWQDQLNSGNGTGPLIPVLFANGSGAGTTGPYQATFSVRVKANTNLTLTIPVLRNPDNLTYHVSVQVLGW
jgi:hypothetical protein